jgi:hypothetical protein
MAILPTPPHQIYDKGGVITTRWCTKGRPKLLCEELELALALQIYSTRLEILCPLYTLSLPRSNIVNVGVPI